MTERDTLNLGTYHFRGVHPKVFFGTASDRYVGWVGQIYSAGQYDAAITYRKKYLNKKAYEEGVLPVASVAEYFTHFRVLELDFTFYRFLLDANADPTPNYLILQQYREHLQPGDTVLLKVPQAVFAPKRYSGNIIKPNLEYLNPEAFTVRFYEPAVAILGDALAGFIFEQEYQRKDARVQESQFVEDLDRFFQAIPRDSRYHLEIRTDAMLTKDYFGLLKAYGLGQVLSHWTWLPSLRKQFERAARQFYNSGHRALIRLLTPRGLKYDESYARAHPFTEMNEGMLDATMVEETAALMMEAILREFDIFVIANNRASGNAPGVARKVAEEFLKLSEGYPS